MERIGCSGQVRTGGGRNEMEWTGCKVLAGMGREQIGPDVSGCKGQNGT